MRDSALVCSRRRSLTAARMLDYLELTKPRILVLLLVAVAVAAIQGGAEGWIVLHVLVGTGLVAASGGAMNQVLERNIDARMERTRSRPLPAGRLASRDAAGLAAALLSVGVVYLAIAVNLLAAALALTTWVLYVMVYTPLKSRTTANTWVGAVAGALPVWIGWSAAERFPDVGAATLFLILFLWQFPHFMAIAWLHRKQYGSAGLKMLTVVDASGLRAGAQAVLSALVLVPVSLVPALSPSAGSVWIYAGWASLLGVLQLTCAAVFLIVRSDAAARWLLRASLVYLPSLLALMMLVTPS